MNRKYLDDLGVTDRLDTGFDKKDKRRKKWHEQRQTYGFDERDTWSMDSAFLMWLYERLNMYVECAENIVDLEYHKFKYKGKEYTQKQIIDMMISDLKYILVRNDTWGDDFHEVRNRTNRVLNLWKIVFFAMWW